MNLHDIMKSNVDRDEKSLVKNKDNAVVFADQEQKMFLAHSITNVGGTFCHPKDKILGITGMDTKGYLSKFSKAPSPRIAISKPPDSQNTKV